MSFKIRKASAADAEGVDALLSAAYSQLLRGHYDPNLLARALPHLTRSQPKLLSSGTFYVAVRKGLLGCGGWTHEAPGSGERQDGLGHVRHFATHPKSVREGVGRAIAATCFREARAAGVTELACLATLPAVPFYLALGFERGAPVAVPLGASLSFPGIHMTCRDLSKLG